MAVRSKIDAKEAFSAALHGFLETIDECPKERGRPMWLWKRIKSHARGRLVSYESVRKWLAGKDIPDQAHLSVLLDAIGASHDDVFPADSVGSGFSSVFQRLSPEERQQVMGFMHGLMASKSKRGAL